jgi:hypothetical protein
MLGDRVMSTPISLTMTWARRSLIPGIVHNAWICDPKDAI